MSKKKEPDVSENPLYHDTWTLLRKYRDVVWNLELSVQRVRRQFQIAKRTVSIENQVFEQESFEQKIINDAFLSQLLKKLTEEEREIITLHIVSGLKHREIAKILQKPLSTVLSKYNRAIGKLKEIAKEVKQ